MNSVNYKRLEKSLTDVIQEAQLKIGYDHHPITLYYPTESVARLLGTPEEDADNTEHALASLSAHMARHPFPHRRQRCRRAPGLVPERLVGDYENWEASGQAGQSGDREVHTRAPSSMSAAFHCQASSSSSGTRACARATSSLRRCAGGKAEIGRAHV